MFRNPLWSIAILLLAQITVAEATPTSISTGYQVEELGYFTGTLDYVAVSPSAASLTLVLNNSSITAAGGKITGVALNVPTVSGVSITGLTSTGPNPYFSQLGLSFGSINTSPLGKFDFGSALGGNWQGGGSPNNGLAVNSTGTFTFNFTGTNLNALSTQSFIDAVSASNSQIPPQFMAVRFKGFTEGDSDKVGAVDPPPVPVPASVWLMLSGLGSLGVISHKRKNA